MFAHSHDYHVIKSDDLDVQQYCQSMFNDFELIFNKAMNMLIEISVSGETSSTQFSDCFHDDTIEFNGLNALKAQRFVINTNPTILESSQRCHTRKNPYDWLVIATLLMMHNTEGVVLDVESDATYQYWEAVANTLNKAIKLPITTSNKVLRPDTANQLLRIIQIETVNMQLEYLHCKIGFVL